MFFGHNEVFLFHISQHRPPRQLVKALLADNALLACVLSEEKIENDTHHGDEDKHEQPHQRLCGLSVLHEHGHSYAEGYQAIDEK